MKVKSIVAVTLSVCLICTGGGYGIYYYMQNNKKPVEVTPVAYLSTQYYGDSSSISGTASSDVNQRVQLSGENTVKEVYVEPGDTVKVGDKLMEYDMTLAELDLEMEKLNKATLGLRLEAAQETLNKLYNTTPVERNDTALVISNHNTVSMVATQESGSQGETTDLGTLTLNPETEPQTVQQIEPLQTEPPQTSAPEQTEVPVTEQTEQQVIVLDPETEPPIVQETEPITQQQTEAVTNPTEVSTEAESEIVLPTIPEDSILPVDILDYDSAADDGEGTKEKPFIFYCTEDAVIKGSFLNLVRGWDKEGTMQIAGGAYVIVAVRAKDAEDGKQRILRLDGNSDKRQQGYYPDSEWRFTTEGLEVLVDQEGNRILEGQTPELIKIKDFEKEFADKTSDETELATEQLTEPETIPQTEVPETIPQTEGETIPQETDDQTQQSESESEMVQTEVPFEQTEQPVSELHQTEESELETDGSEIQKLENIIIQEVSQTETQEQTDFETETDPETETEIETETESEMWIDLATLPEAMNRPAVKLSYGSIDKERYISGSGTADDPYVFVCVENAQITGGFLNRVMGFDKEGKNRDIQKSCYVQLEIRKDTEGLNDYNGETVTRLVLDGTAAADSGFNGTDIWIFSRLGLNKQEVPGEPEEPEDPQEPLPGEEIEELGELTYESLGDENYEHGTYYKGTGTAQDPFTFRCSEGAIISGSFINRVLGYDESGEARITDGCYVRLEIKDPDTEDGFIETITINGTEKHDAFPPTISFIFTRDGLQIVEETIEDETEWWDDEYIDDGYWDGGITYTAEELKAAIREQEEMIKSLTLDEREAQLRINEYEQKVEAGTVLSSINGVVKTVGDPKTGESNGEAFIVVTSNSGMYIVGNMNELNLETLKIGDEVSVQSLETGMQYTASITELSQYPASSNSSYYGYGNENTNASYYPFKAYVEDAEGLNDGAYVTISISADVSGLDKLYLQMAYVRTENGQSYVYKAGDDGKLKKQYVKTGQIIYSSYVEIKEGLTMDDSVAFPYGSNVVDGAKIQVSDGNSFYY